MARTQPKIRLCPDDDCEWCGGLLSKDACVKMREDMKDPERRERLIQNLEKAFNPED